jgi:hypothetical protein
MFPPQQDQWEALADSKERNVSIQKIVARCRDPYGTLLQLS